VYFCTEDDNSLSEYVRINCSNVKKIPKLKNVITLFCYNCPNLRKISESKSLETIICVNCPKLKKISKLENIKILECTNCPELAIVPKSNSLEKSEFVNCPKINIIPEPVTVLTIPDKINNILNSKDALYLKYYTERHSILIEPFLADINDYMERYGNGLDKIISELSIIVKELNNTIDSDIHFKYVKILNTTESFQCLTYFYNELLQVHRNTMLITRFGLSSKQYQEEVTVKLTYLFNKFNKFIDDVVSSGDFQLFNIYQTAHVLNIKKYTMPESGVVILPVFISESCVKNDEMNKKISYYDRRYNLFTNRYIELKSKLMDLYNKIYSCISTNNEMKNEFDTIVNEDLQSCKDMHQFYNYLYNGCKLVIAQ
jgi:hypothetical protein